MIPFILTIVGGYLIGDSMKESGNIFADGGMMADGGETGTETINLKFYNIHDQVIRNGDVILDYKNETIKVPSGKIYRVENDSAYTFRILKTKIKAKDGIRGLEKFLKEINNSNSALNSYTTMFIDPIDKKAWGGKMAEGGEIKTLEDAYKYLKEVRGFDDVKRFQRLAHLSDASLINFAREKQEEDDDIEAKMDQVKPYAEGGSIAEGNNQMLRSKVKEVKHHADELGKSVKPKTEVEAWVVAKAERSASDLSDITHYLEGKHK